MATNVYFEVKILLATVIEILLSLIIAPLRRILLLGVFPLLWVELCPPEDTLKF